MNILKRGKKQDILNWYLANQEGDKNIKMYEIENLEIILLCSGPDLPEFIFPNMYFIQKVFIKVRYAF